MARSPYWPHPTYLDTPIVFTILITGCHASKESGDMAGVIAGSAIACMIFVAAIAAIVYYIVKAHRSRKSKKQKIMKASNRLDCRTMVLRKIPTGHRGYPSIVGYPEYMVGYQPPFQNPQMSMVPHMATISHMPVQRPPMPAISFATSRPRKEHISSREKSIEDRKPKRKSRPTSSTSVPDDLIIPDNNMNSRDDGDESQFILRPKDDYYSKSRPALSSLFSRDPESTQTTDYGFYPEKETPKEEIYADVASTSAFAYPPTYSTSQPAQEQEQEQEQEQQRASPVFYPPKINSQRRNNSEVMEFSEPMRPASPDYDLELMVTEEVPTVDPSFTNRNKFSYAATEELKRNTRFRDNSSNIEDATAYPFDSTSKQVQFNHLSSGDTRSSIQTNHLATGTHGYIPQAPPFPPS